MLVTVVGVLSRRRGLSSCRFRSGRLRSGFWRRMHFAGAIGVRVHHALFAGRFVRGMSCYTVVVLGLALLVVVVGCVRSLCVRRGLATAVRMAAATGDQGLVRLGI